MAAGFWLLVLVAVVGFLLALVLDHFLPLFLKYGLAPKGTFGWPILEETLRFLQPHTSNSIGTFLQEHCSRYVPCIDLDVDFSSRLSFCLLYISMDDYKCWLYEKRSENRNIVHEIFRYGKVFKAHLFFCPTVVSCDQELNYFILQNEGKLFQCSYPKPIHGILGNLSMLVAVGGTHKRLRNVALSLVSITKSKPEFLQDIERIAVQILGSWKGKPKVIFCDEARKVH